jgi:hypothetical protein
MRSSPLQRQILIWYQRAYSEYITTAISKMANARAVSSTHAVSTLLRAAVLGVIAPIGGQRFAFARPTVLPSGMEDTVLHVGRECVRDIRLARIHGAEEVACGIRRRPLNRGANVLILSPKSGRVAWLMSRLTRFHRKM